MTKQQVLDIAGNSINYLGTMASLIYAPANDSNTGAGGAVNGALTGAAAGASLGSVIPGIGTVAGGIIGGVGGFLTSAFKKGNVTTNGYYGDPTMQKGGILANNGKLRRRYNWAKDVVQANRAGLVSSELAENNWLQDHDADVMTFANGGIGSSVVLGDAGEYYKTPDGDIRKIKEDHSPKDSHAMVVKDGTKILSDTLKAPGTNKTWSKLFEGMAATKKSKFNDRFAENAAKLNNMNNNMLFDLLFALQEADKLRKGIKPKYKQLVQAAETGAVAGDDNDERKAKVGFMPNTGTRNVSRYYYYTVPNEFTPEERSPNAGAMFGQLKERHFTQQDVDNSLNRVNEIVKAYNPNNLRWSEDTPWWYVPTGNVNNAAATTTSRGTGRKVAVSKPAANTVLPTVAPQVVAPQVETVIDESELTYPKPELEPVLDYTPVIKKPTTDDGTDDDVTTSSNGFDWGNLLSSFGSLAPILSGLNAKPEDVRTNYNPYENIILNTMRRRRFNIDPAIQDVNRNRAISRYNMSQMNTNTGANLAYSMQSAVDTNRAIANLRSQESNINNSYLADYANTANSLGQQRVAAENLSDDQRAQNRAAADNMIATAGSNLGEWFENQTLMGNLKQRDMEMLPLYSALLNAGTKYADYRSLMENNTRHIRKKDKKGGKKNDSQSV